MVDQKTVLASVAHVGVAKRLKKLAYEQDELDALIG
jgi:hypothetical protein